MKTLFAGLTFLFCISVAFGLLCYECHSSESMAACDDAKKQMPCRFFLNPRCVKQSFKYTALLSSGVLTKVESYDKSCTTKATCDAAEKLKLCQAADGDCKFDCCDGDLCNGGAVPVASVLLMVACALVVLYR